MRRSDLHQIIKEEYDNLMLEGIVSWMVDKVANAAKWYVDKKAHYNYEALMSSKEFKSLAKNYGMDEDKFVAKAKQLVKDNPKRFIELLDFDISKSKYRKFMK